MIELMSVYWLISLICISSLTLVFIMFYGGFGTNWKTAKNLAMPSIEIKKDDILV